MNRLKVFLLLCQVLNSADLLSIVRGFLEASSTAEKSLTTVFQLQVFREIIPFQAGLNWLEGCTLE